MSATVLLDIPQALELRAQEVLQPLVGARIAYPNVAFTPVDGQPWAKLDHLPARTAPAGVGVAAQTRRPGLFQVTLFYPLGQGMHAGLTAAQVVCTAFKRGTALERNGTLLRVQSASLSPSLREEGWWALPVSILWLVHSQD